jgi:hypothetical protein
MKYSHDDDVLIPLAEINAVGKSLRDGFACASMQNGELLRVVGNALEQVIYFGEEFKSKPCTFSFVPIASFV